MILGYRLRRRLRTLLLPVLMILLVFAAGFSLVYYGNDILTGFAITTPTVQKVAPPLLGNPFALEDYVPVEAEVFAEGILLRGPDCKGLWIAMPYEKTFSIKRGEQGVFDIRPTQHDLMYDILTNYNITMDYARIERVEYDFYYATVLLETEDKILQLDTRPSDALALAKRMHAPVYIAKKLLRQQGKTICNEQQT